MVGGTVDMCTFKVTNTSDREYNLREITLGDGKAVGSVMLDLNFERYLRNVKLGPACDVINPQSFAAMLQSFIQEVKTIFKQGKKD